MKYMIGSILILLTMTINSYFDIVRHIEIRDKLNAIQSDTRHIGQIVEDEEAIGEWELLYQAICQHESSNNPKAVNKKTDAAGLIQIMPEGEKGYLDEANKYKKKYTNKDRFDPIKTREMWDIVQSRYNPQKDIHWAMKIHNPRGSIQYHIDIVKIMDGLKTVK